MSRQHLSKNRFRWAAIVLSSGLYLWLARGKASIEARMAESERQEAASPAAAL